MNLILFDNPVLREALFPLTLTRPVSEIRVGILTLTQKWERHLRTKASFFTGQYLAEKYPLHLLEENLWINGGLCPDNNLLEAIRQLPKNTCLTQHGLVLAARNTQKTYITADTPQIEYIQPITLIDRPWKIFQHNARQIALDYRLITAGKTSHPIGDTYTRCYGKVGKDIFIEPGAHIRDATLNAEEGPIYLGKNTVVQEGALIHGPFALCEGAEVSMGAKIRGQTTVGPHAKVGGEISCTVFFGYSNKSHDGFLGHSVVGTWCNLGAGTNASNLKNSYSNIKLWDHGKKAFVETGLQFCGLIMGDYNRCGINTMFNTGTTVSIGCNIYGSGFPPSFIPSFTWGGIDNNQIYRFEALITTIKKAMARRKKNLTPEELHILKFLFNDTQKNRQRN